MSNRRKGRGTHACKSRRKPKRKTQANESIATPGSMLAHQAGPQNAVPTGFATLVPKTSAEMRPEELKQALEAFSDGINPYGDQVQFPEEEFEALQALAKCILQLPVESVTEFSHDSTVSDRTTEKPFEIDCQPEPRKVNYDHLSQALASGSSIGYYNSDGSFHYVQRRSELPLEQRLATAEQNGESVDELRADEELYVTAASGDLEQVRHRLGDTFPHRLVSLYFRKHRFGIESRVSFFLSTLPPSDRVEILEQIVADDPHNVDAYDKLAMAYLKSGQRREAHRRLERAQAEGLITEAFLNVMNNKLGLLDRSSRGGYGSASNYEEALAQLNRHVEQDDEKICGEFLSIYRAFCALAISRTR